MNEAHFENALNVFAFASNTEIAGFIKQYCHESEYSRYDEVMKLWQNIQPYVQQMANNENNIADTIQVKKVPTRYNKMLDAYRDDVLFAKTFPPHRTEFGIVEIDKLVAAQKTVNLDFCEKLIEEMRGKTDMKHLIKTCLSPDRKQESVQYMENSGSHIFTSPNSDIRFLGSYLKELIPEDMEYAGGGLPIAAIISFIGYGVAPINVIRTPTRIVLHNGFHRVYACRALGIKEIPVVIKNVSNPLLEFPVQLNGLPREYLLNTPRPTLVKDFFDPNLTLKFKIKKKLKMVKLQVTPTAHDIPY